MSAETIAATVLPDAPAGAPAAVAKVAEREFHIGLACALALHALLLIGIVGFASVPEHIRRMGEKGGADDGISVVLVSEADFKSRSTVPLDGGQPAARPSAATRPSQAAEPTPQPAERATEPQPEQAQPNPPQKQAATALAKESPDLLSVPDLAGKPPPREQPAEKREAKPQQQPQPQQQSQQPQQQPQPAKPQQRPNLTAALPTPPGDNSASFSRPAGITRSGENDDFARGVIRALRQTMPPGRGSLGRVTIRFLLSDNGNLMEVNVVTTSGNTSLTQDVVFSSRQSNFPFPPKGATVADRTFLVTYIYE